MLCNCEPKFLIILKIAKKKRLEISDGVKKWIMFQSKILFTVNRFNFARLLSGNKDGFIHEM